MKCGKVISDERMRKALELTNKFNEAWCKLIGHKPKLNYLGNYIMRTRDGYILCKRCGRFYSEPRHAP